MATMADAVNPLNVPTGQAAVAGYIDGPKSKWPDASWDAFTMPKLHVTVLANPAAMAFDLEPGNAGASAVALGVKSRFTTGLPSVVYVDKTTSENARNALQLQSVPWWDVDKWPAPGAYLWAADPTVEPGTVPEWCWIKPVAVQDRDLGTYDLSTLFGGWLPQIIVPHPIPQPTTPKEVTPEMLIALPDGSIAAKGNSGHLLIFKPNPAGTPPYTVLDVTDSITAANPGEVYTID